MLDADRRERRRGANAQKSIGFATLSGMIGSTLLTVAVVPSLFVVLQQIEARLTSPQARSAAWRRMSSTSKNSNAPAAPPPLTIALTKFV